MGLNLNDLAQRRLEGTTQAFVIGCEFIGIDCREPHPHPNNGRTMKISETSPPGVLLPRPRKLRGARGALCETWHTAVFA